MATTIKKGLICKDETLDEGLYPYTSVDCVFDENSVPLSNTIDDLREDIEDSKSSIVTLWTNGSPTTGFRTKTIDIAPTKPVKLYIIEMRYYATSSSNYTFNFVLTPLQNGTPIAQGFRFDGSTNHLCGRAVYLSNNGTRVNFGVGYRMATYGDCNTEDNNIMIPLRINVLY